MLQNPYQTNTPAPAPGPSWPPQIQQGHINAVLTPFFSQRAAERKIRIAAWVYGVSLILDLVRIGATNAMSPQLNLVFALVSFVVFVALGVLYLIWVHAMTCNLAAFGTVGYKVSPGWAVGYYFIPIINLGRPYDNMAAAWKASNPRNRFERLSSVAQE